MNKQRKRRTQITTEIIQLVRKAIERNKSTREISEQIELSYNSTLLLVGKICNGRSDAEILGAKKGPKIKPNTEIKSQIMSMLSEDNSLTQAAIKDGLAEAGVVRSQGFISTTLKQMEMTRKRLVKVPIERNSPRVLDLRRTYALELQHYALEKLIYLDETGFNLHTSTNYGYSPKNSKAYIMTPANKGINISLMAAIGMSGVIAYQLRDGAYNGDSFLLFIQSQLLSYFRDHPHSIILMDNCRFHHRSDILRVFNENNIIYKFLPPYSPHLNPIEEYFGELKATYKAIRPLSQTRLVVKERVLDLIKSRSGNFRSLFERARNLIPTALARMPFI